MARESGGQNRTQNVKKALNECLSEFLAIKLGFWMVLTVDQRYQEP